MESKTILLVLNIVIFSCLMQSSFALKCFVCDSSANPKCRDLSDHALQPQECIAENFLSQGAGLFSQLGFGGSSNSASKSEDLSPICLKVVTHNTTHASTISRRCAVKLQNQDPCSLARQTFQQTGVNIQLDFCGSCNDKDGCNSANAMKIFSMLVVFGAMLSTARLFV